MQPDDEMLMGDRPRVTRTHGAADRSAARTGDDTPAEPPCDVLALHQLWPADATRTGRKAATLAVLRRAGFPVPDGFVVPADALERAARAAGLDPDCTPEQAATLDFDETLTAQILAAAQRLGSGPFAVRSSGVDEDGLRASHAGQYRSILGVAGGAALLQAVRRCWASTFAGHVGAYRTARGLSPRGRLAVLVQPLVPAQAAGVAFTANPVTQDRGETVVNAVPGLGDQLVDGAVSPDEWLVRGTSARRCSGEADAIDATRVLAVADLARRVEAHQGSPQDIEWALAGGELVLLQARPITSSAAAPEPVPAQPPPGYWTREASHAPLPWTPFSRVLLDVRNEAVRFMCAELGFLLDGVELRDIGGWEYLRLVPLGGKDRRPPPEWLVPVLARLVGPLRRRVATAITAHRADVPARLVARWYDEWLPGLSRRLEALRTVEPSAQSPADVGRHFDDVVALFDEAILVHFRLQGAIALMLGELVFTCRDLFGWDDAATLELLSGLSDKSTEPSRRLAALAAMARTRPVLRDLLANSAPASGAPTADTDPEFAAAFAAYQRDYGCRALRYEAADPSLAELPGLTLGLIRDQLAQGYDPAADTAELRAARVAAEGNARALLTTCSPDRFDRALDRARRAYPVREDNEFFTVSGPLALVRRATLAIGQRLAERRQVDRPEDVFFLEPAEVGAALRSGADQHEPVARRSGRHAWVLAHPGPPSYGPEPGPPPSFARMPPEVAAAMEALLWYVDRTLGPPTEPAGSADDKILHGIGVSAGRYTGPVRILNGEGEFDRLHPGDVLVCPITSPVWSVLFPSIGALVTDTGGMLSHPAIIAREYRVPAVVATGRATRLLHDGQLVTVDGTTGAVEMVS
jgi:phosphohistidine swiveling domain-containing protein